MKPHRNQGLRSPVVVRWAALLIATSAFLALALSIQRFGRPGFDVEVLSYLHAHQAPVLTWFARALSTLGSVRVVAVVSLVLVAWLAIGARGARRPEAWFLAIAIGGSAALNVAGKRLFALPRPELFAHLAPASGFTFPSGHATVNAALYLGLALVAFRLLPRRWAWMSLFGVGLSLAIGATRPYLQVHYPSDVLAGWSLGSAWALIARSVSPARASTGQGDHGQLPEDDQHHPGPSVVQLDGTNGAEAVACREDD